LRAYLAFVLTSLVCGCSHSGARLDDLGNDAGSGEPVDYDGGFELDFSSPFDFANADLATGPIVVTPDPVDFGAVVNKTTATRAVTITNPGGAVITIQSATASGAGFSIDAAPLPAALAAGQSTTLMVSFAPMVGGAAAGSLSIVHDGGASPAKVPLVGQSIHAVDLSWNASTSPGVSGYNIYRGAVPGGPYPLKVNPTLNAAVKYEDIQVPSCKTYYYVVTAVDAMNTESGYSNEASAAVPCP
jgi:hypothetical protein